MLQLGVKLKYLSVGNGKSIKMKGQKLDVVDLAKANKRGKERSREK